MMRKSKLLFLVLMCVLSIEVHAQQKKTGVIEIVYSGSATEEQKIKHFFELSEMINSDNVYRWKNHFVYYSDSYNFWYDVIRSKFKNCKVKLYKNPFYDFERSRCSDKTVAKQWENIILTANLVKYPNLQQEYLSYHKTQFEKWPEVSQGFCNASFQQLLVFRNGRQLMLIISIPKGKTLDELNPLTTKDNPKVDEWNKIMSKYQEGIEGTAKGETWVFFKPYVK